MIATINLNTPKSVELGMLYYKILSEEQDKVFYWKKKLREKGVKAALPIGDYNEQNNKVDFYSPIFNDGIEIGDKIAIGNPYNYFLVDILRIDEESFCESYFVKTI